MKLRSIRPKQRRACAKGVPAGPEISVTHYLSAAPIAARRSSTYAIAVMCPGTTSCRSASRSSTHTIAAMAASIGGDWASVSIAMRTSVGTAAWACVPWALPCALRQAAHNT